MIPIPGSSAATASRRTASINVLHLLIAVIVGISLSAQMACATTWAAPLRPLTHDEKLEVAVSEADAIVLANVVSFEVAQSGFQSGSVVLRPISVLKGVADGDELRAALIDGDFPEPLATNVKQGRSPGVVLVFLRRDDNVWLLDSSPYGVAGGLLPVLPAEISSVRAKTMAQIRRQSLDSLVTRADLIVVGHRLDKFVPCTLFGRKEMCPTVAIDKPLYGEAASTTIRTYSLVLGHIASGPNLFFLRRVADDLYETIAFQMGSIPIRPNGRVERLEVPISAVGQRVSDLKAHKGRE